MAFDIVDTVCVEVEAESENGVLDLLDMLTGLRHLIREFLARKKIVTHDLVLYFSMSVL